jgi:DHA2 family multidrug resistance protein
MTQPLNRRMITLSIMAATIMQTLDGTIANVALPHMQGTLSASQDQIAWVLTAYIVAAAIATPLTGWLVDRFGQKRVFLASVIGFTIASALCGISSSLTEIVAARLLQGVFGAALVPMSQMVLMDINPPEKQGSAMAIWGVGVMVGPILGPTLGGWLTDSYDWRWVFFINIPIGALATYGIWRYIRPTPGTGRMQFDLFGFVSLSLSVGALQLLMDRGQQNDWFSSTETWIEATVLLIAFTYFVAHTALTRADQSFLDYRLLKNGNYLGGLVFIFIVGLVLYATRATLSPAMRAQGTAIYSLVRNVGSSIGISLVQTVLERNTVAVHASLVEKITQGNPSWNNPAVASAYDLSRAGGAAALDALVEQQSQMIAYVNDFRLMLYLTLAVIPLLLFLRPPGPRTESLDAHAIME